jgi:hypothetical protein
MPSVSSQSLQIFQNPRDLKIVVKKRRRSGNKYFFRITRGPGGNYQQILRPKDFSAESVDKAIGEVENALGVAYGVAMGEPGDKSSGTLTQELVGKIMAELRSHQMVETWKMGW